MPKIVDHNLHRELLLDRCFDLFAEKGFVSVTLRDIAKELEVSTGALYHYFPSKQAILEQMLIHKGSKDVAEATRRMADTGSFEDRLKIFFDYFVDSEAHFKRLLLVSLDFLRNARTEEAKKLVNRWSEFYLSNMQQFLSIPREIAQLIMVFFNGIVYQAMLFPETISTKEQMGIFSEILLAYLREHQNPANRLCRRCPFVTDR